MKNSSVVLLTYTGFAEFVETFYAMRQVQPSAGHFFLSQLAFVWVIWWWLSDDSGRRGISWGLDLGMFLPIAWPILVPYHLFKTRGFAGFIPILWFVLAMAFGLVAAIVVSMFV